MSGLRCPEYVRLQQLYENSSAAPGTRIIPFLEQTQLVSAPAATPQKKKTAVSRANSFCSETVVPAPTVDTANWLECKTTQQTVDKTQLGSVEFDQATERADSATK
jgi:hypothetical protein